MPKLPTSVFVLFTLSQYRLVFTGCGTINDGNRLGLHGLSLSCQRNQMFRCDITTGTAWVISSECSVVI